MILAALAVIVTLPAAITTVAQDDVYYSRRNSRNQAYEATAADNWSTRANDDWDVDAYNRRSSSAATEATSTPEFTFDNDKLVLSTGKTTVPDTVYVVEQYYNSNRIRRFHNPHFTWWMWDPWYDVAYWDPYFWDYCYWDPWWYVTPAFGFHWGNWWYGWNHGYYTGWYGGWYSPFYDPFPHHCGPHWVGGGWLYRNNMGGHYAHNGFNGRSGFHSGRATASRGSGVHSQPGMASRDNFSLRHSNMRGNLRSGNRPRSAGGGGGGIATRGTGRSTTSSQRGTVGTAGRDSRGSISRSGNTSGMRSRSLDNSGARRSANGVRQSGDGRTVTRQSGIGSQRGTSRSGGVGSSRGNGTVRMGGYSGGSSHSGGYSGGSTRSGGYSGGSYGGSSGGGRSSGGGGSHSGGGGGHSGGGRR